MVPYVPLTAVRGCLQSKRVDCNVFIDSSAGVILNMPYVQEHLASFIKEKENLQEALHARYCHVVFN